MRLPENTPLGTLTLVSVLIDYDGPQLFVCENQFHDHYLVTHAPKEVDNDNWIYARISRHNLKKITSNQLSLHEAFTKPTTKIVSIVSFNDNNDILYREKDPNEMPPDYLPLPGIYLTLTSPTNSVISLVDTSVPSLQLDAPRSVLGADLDLPLFDLPPDLIEIFRKSKTSVLSAANHFHRCVLDVMLSSSDYRHGRYELPVIPLAGVLANLQRLVDTLVEDSGGTEKRRPRANLRELTQINAVAVFPSSFGLRLETHQSDFLPEGRTVRVIQKLWDVVASLPSETRLLKRFMELNFRQRAHLRGLIVAIKRTRADLGLDLGVPGASSISAQSITYSQIVRAASFLDALSASYNEDINFQGNLMAASLKSKFFVLESDEAIISGKISDACLPQMAGLRIGTLHDATLIATHEVNENTGEETNRYTLISIAPYG